MTAMKRALVVAPLALTMLVGVSSQVEAVTKTWSSKPYYVTLESYSTPLKKCLVVNLTGKMEYLWWYKRQGSKEKWVQEIRLKAPAMTMDVKGQCGRHGAPTNLTGADLSQRFYDSGCTTSTAITINAPFAVGVTPTRKCGRIKTAKRSTTSTAKGSSYSQYNSGRPATFKKTFGVAPISGRDQVCLRVDAIYTAHSGTDSDSFAKDAKVCVKAY